MKKVKYLLILIFSLFIVSPVVNAGVCDGKTQMRNGYCKTDGYYVTHYKYENFTPIKGQDGGAHIAKTGFRGENNEYLCLDGNLSGPTGGQTYHWARNLNPNSELDRGVIKIYQMMIDNISKGVTNTTQSYHEATIAIRVYFVTKGYTKAGLGQMAHMLNHYTTIERQFKGQSIPSNLSKMYQLTPGASYNRIKAYYDAAILASKDKTKIKTFELKVNALSEKSTTEYAGDNFTISVPIRVSGLTDYRTKVNIGATPSVKLTAAVCDNPNLTCTVSNENLLSKSSTNDAEEVMLYIKGNSRSIVSASQTKVDIKYEAYHPSNPGNIIFLEHNDSFYQRMMLLGYNNPTTGTLAINQKLVAMCKTEVTDGKPSYEYGGNKVTEYEYVQNGCCNLDPHYMKDDKAIEYYLENCDEAEVVQLVYQCNNETKEYSSSFIRQHTAGKDMSSLMSKITEAEKLHAEGTYDDEALQSLLSKYNNKKDDQYVNNPYCTMYTSERVDVLLPGTAEATSGQFFIFKEGEQPKVSGEIYASFHTNVSKWEKDYKAAIQKEKELYTNPSSSAYKKAVADRKELEKQKLECETKSNIYDPTKTKQNWNYYLAPDVTFYYNQNTKGSSNPKDEITEVAEMVISTKASKFWPNVTEDPKYIESSAKGHRATTTYTDSYGGASINFTYDTTTDYQVGYRQDVYYRPKIYYYSLVPSGMYVTDMEHREATNKLDIGYVFNIKITNFEGWYETWFEINNLGHLKRDPNTNANSPKLTSNIQNAINSYLEKHKKEFLNRFGTASDGVYSNKCFYENREKIVTPNCRNCVEPAGFNEEYFYRQISLENVNPSKRDNGIWDDDRGLATLERIESLGDSIYNDKTNEFTEAVFTLGPNDLKEIQKYNKQNSYDDFSGLTCTNGKECQSSFLTMWAEKSKTKSILDDARQNKNKYYIVDPVTGKGKIVTGSQKTIFENGTYPENDANYALWP